MALPTVWPLAFIPTGHHGHYDWLGEEVCAAGPDIHDTLQKMVVDGGALLLPEYVIITRVDGTTVSLGPSLTQPHRQMKKVEIVTTARGPTAQPRGEEGEEDSGFEDGSDEEQEFDDMMEKRREGLSDEERKLEDEDLLEEEAEDIKEEKDEESDDEEVDAEERRRRTKQRRRKKQGECYTVLPYCCFVVLLLLLLSSPHPSHHSLP